MAGRSSISHLIEREIRRSLPQEVRGVITRADTDFEGDPVLRVWVILRDGDALDVRRAARLPTLLQEILRRRDATTYPVLSFVTESEAGDIEAEAA